MSILIGKTRIYLWSGAIALLALLIAAAPANAVDYTWDGGGVDDSLLTGENWNPDAVPMFDVTSATTSSIFFTGNTKTSPTIPEGQNPQFNNATFDANAAAFTIGLAGTTGSFRLGSTGSSTMRNLVNDSPYVQTFNAPVLIAVATINANTQGFVFNSTYSPASSTSSRRTNVTGNYDVWFNAGISGKGKDTTSADTAGAINIKTNATVHIPVASSSTDTTDSLGGLWNGVFNIYTGALRISHNNALGAGSDLGSTAGRTIIQGGANTGRLELTGGISISERFLLGSRSADSGFAPQIASASGNNVLTGLIENSTGGSYQIIQSDGTAEGDLLTLAGDLSCTASGTRYLRLQGAGDGKITGNLLATGGTWRVFKIDGGTWTIASSGNTYTSGTYIQGGTLALTGDGSIATSNHIQVDAGATFDVSGVTGGLWSLSSTVVQNLVGSGTVKGNVQDSPTGSTISGGTLGTAGTLTFTNNLTLSGSNTLQFDLGPDLTIGGGLNDLLSVGGNLSLNGITTVAINNLDTVQGFAAGTYRLIDYTGALTGDASNFTVSSIGTSRQNFSLSTATPKQVNLTVTGAPLNLTWKGDGASNYWDLVGTANWNNNTEKFYTLDSVTFDDSGSNNPAVYLTGDMAPGAITVNNTAKDYVFSGYGAIVGNTGLTKDGTAKLTIDNSGVNTFKGPIAINEGTLEVGSVASGGYSGNLGTGPVTLAAGATLAFNRSDAMVVANIISGAGTLELNGLYGSLDLTGANDNFAGPVTVSQGTLKLTATNDTGTVAGLPDITNNAAVQLDSAAATWTVNRRIVGAGAVEKTGANRVSTSFANTYSGGTKISAGVLRLTGTEGSLGSGSIDVVSDGTLTFYRTGAYTVSNVISGGGAVTFDRPEGVVTLAGDNATYDGIASINDGTVILESATGLGSALGYTYISSSTAAQLVLTNNITIDEPITFGLRGSSTNYAPHLVNVSGSNTINGPITTGTGGSRAVIQSNGTAPGDLLTLANSITNTTTGTDLLSLRGAGNGLISGSISNGTGEWRVQKFDAGTWTLTGSNSFTSYAAIYEGTLALKDYGSIISSMGVVFPNATGVFDVSQTSTQTFSMGSAQGLVGAGTVVGNVATSIGSQIAPSGPVVIANAFTGGTSRLNYPGGTMTIQGTSATTGLDLYGGESLVFKLTANTASAANDKIQVNGQLNLLNNYGNTNVLIVPGAGLGPAGSEYTLINAASQSGVFNFAVDPNHNTRYTLSLINPTPGVVKLKVDGGASASLTWAGTASNVWDLKTTANWTGADGLFYQADAVSFTDVAPDDKLEVTIGDATNPYLYPAAVVVDSSKNFTFSGTGSIDNCESLTKFGTGTLTINNSNGYLGTTFIYDGALVAGSGDALGSSRGGTIISGGTLDSNGQDFNDEPINVQGMGVGNNGALVNNSTTKNYLRYITLDGPAAIGGSGNWDITGPVVAGSGVLPGYLHGGGHALTKVGAGEIDLLDLGDTGLGDINITGGRLYFQGNTTMGDNAKAVTLSNGAWLGLWNPTVTHSKTIVVAESGGQIDNWEGPGAMASPIALVGNVNVSTGNASTLTLNGAIVGAGGLTKINSNAAGGVLILSGENTYEGETVISQGTLELAATGQISPLSAITNNAVFQVNGGDHTLGTITGSGTMTVADGTVLTATSITQDSLTIGGTIAPPVAAAVPEPGTWLLLLVGVLTAAAFRRWCNR